jgi:heat shock protein HslJ
VKHRLWLLVTLIGLLTFTPGCTSGPSVDGKWTATSARPQTLVADAAVVLTFANGRLSGTAGCNSFGGAFSVAAGTLKVPQLATTLMYCEGPRGEQETWVMALLSSSPTVSVNGDTLILTGTASTVTFRRG